MSPTEMNRIEQQSRVLSEDEARQPAVPEPYGAENVQNLKQTQRITSAHPANLESKTDLWLIQFQSAARC